MVLRIFYGCILFAAFSASAIGQLEGLTVKQSRMLNDVIAPAYYAANAEQLAVSVSELLRTADDKQRGHIDRWAEQNKLPELPKILAGSRYQLALRGNVKALPPMGALETVACLQLLHDRLTEATARIEKLLPDADQPLTEKKSLDDYREYLRELDIADNDAANHILAANYATKLTKSVPRRKRRNLTEAQAELFALPYAKFKRELRNARELLEEIEIETRCYRLMTATKVLSDQENPIERIKAAYAVARDGDVLDEFFGYANEAAMRNNKNATRRAEPNQEQRVFQRKRLNTPKLPQRILAETKRARELAGERLLAKSQELFDGFYWWERGRYGIADYGFGLLKSALANKSESAMNEVSMPYDRPIPTASAQAERPVPTYPRRHNHIWNIEDRRFALKQARISSINDMSLGVTSAKSTIVLCGVPYEGDATVSNSIRTSTTDVQTRRRMKRSDPFLERRLMGHYEYSRALSQLGKYVADATPDELAVAESIVRSHPELKVPPIFGNQIERHEDEEEANDPRRGPELARMMGLARVELAGMAAGFTGEPAPFLKSQPTMYEMEAFRECLRVRDSRSNHLRKSLSHRPRTLRHRVLW